jgi:acetyl-CoA C-acetyltransferase
MQEVYVVAATRTAGGRRGGRLSSWHPVDLAAIIIDTLVKRSGIDPITVDDVIMGCVSQIGEQSMNVARNAVLASSLPESVPGTSLDRQCGSSQQALHFATQAIMSGTMDVVIAAGVESMSRIPMASPWTLAMKNGMGSYVSPRLSNRYPGVEFSQFNGAEYLAEKYELSRAVLDEFAYRSHKKAIEATEMGRFKHEITPIHIMAEDGGLGEHHEIDEGIRFNVTLDGIAQVKPIQEGGRVTAASASQICDGASGVLLVSEKALKTFGLQPLARIHHISVLGHDPVGMLEAPIPATLRALQRAGLKLDNIDLYEVNEAFAPVPLAWVKGTGADPERLNVNGGAIALGHPMGASGTKLMTTLLYALHDRDKRYGLQTMCEFGGMANVAIVERL